MNGQYLAELLDKFNKSTLPGNAPIEDHELEALSDGLEEVGRFLSLTGNSLTAAGVFAVANDVALVISAIKNN